jgi:signal transduction histidine kinase
MSGTEDSGVRADEIASPRRWPARLTIRRTLYAGFGLIFVLWVASGYDVVRRLNSVEERANAVSARSAAADQHLSIVRVRALVASIYLRDALFDTSPNAGAYYRAQMSAARREIEQALVGYVPVAGSRDERESFQRLQAEVSAFWETVMPVLEWDASRRSVEARVLLRERVIPRRELILRMSERIQGLNRVALLQERAADREIYASMRRRVWLSSGLALVASIVVAAVATRYASHLEDRVHRQALRDAENSRNLQRLSSKLVNAQEDERRTIARELHDEIGQALTAIKVDLSIVGKNRWLTTREGVAYQEARGLTERTLQQVRDLSQLLHPAMLDDLGLPETVAWYLNGFSARTGIRADLVQDRMDERLAVEIETCLYRIVQEALTNVARHAEAHHCRVYLQRLANTVLLTVEDDGRGFPVAERPAGARRTGGLGLLGIEERVTGFQGSLQIETTPGQGTRLTVELPALPRVRISEPGVASPQTSGRPSQEQN